MDDIISCNRATLNSVPKWIEQEHWEKPYSLYNYGLPPQITHLIDLPISKALTEADMLCSFMLEMQNKSGQANYLEIGVSVGKTFYQLARFANEKLAGARLSCVDIEKINPTFNALLDRLYGNDKVVTRIPATRLTDSMRCEDHNVITRWRDSTITYYESDEFDPEIWKAMPKKYNVLFSDALHEPTALLCEYQQLKSNNLLDENGFIYCFDDLEGSMNGRMWGAVLHIFEDLKVSFPNLTLSLEHAAVNGWIGQYYSKHNFGIIRAF